MKAAREVESYVVGQLQAAGDRRLLLKEVAAAGLRHFDREQVRDALLRLQDRGAVGFSPGTDRWWLLPGWERRAGVAASAPPAAARERPATMPIGGEEAALLAAVPAEGITPRALAARLGWKLPRVKLLVYRLRAGGRLRCVERGFYAPAACLHDGGDDVAWRPRPGTKSAVVLSAVPDEGIRPSELAPRLRMNTDAVNSLLAYLHHRGVLERRGGGVYARAA